MKRKPILQLKKLFAKPTALEPVAPKPVKAEEKTLIKAINVSGGEIQRHASGIMPAGAPEVHCNICILNNDCPSYQANHDCAYKDSDRDIQAQNADEISTLAARVFEENVMRFRRARRQEETQFGGEPDQKVTRLSESVMRQAKILSDIIKTRKQVKVEAKGQGILSQVFGNLVEKKTTQELGPDIEVREVKD